MLGIETLLFIILAVLIVSSVVTVYAAFIAAPFAPTPKKSLRKAFEIVELKAGERFYDIGAGNGTALIMAAREFRAHATGFELSLHHYAIAWLKTRLLGLNNDQADIQLKDFFKADISNADVIFAYLTPRAFRKLEDKFKKEIKPGARVVIFSSPLKFWEPYHVETMADHAKIYFYRKQ